MIRTLKNYRPRTIASWGLAAGLICSGGMFAGFNTGVANATPSLIEFRWESSKNYRKLYYYQSSSRKRDKAKYFLVLRPKDRKTAILKLTITVPEHFKASIKPRKLSLCRMQLGGMLEKTKCLEKIPAVIEVSEDQKTIDVFPDKPVSTEGSVAVVMKIFNPRKRGMFQFNALVQAPGDVPMAGYVGSWNIDIN